MKKLSSVLIFVLICLLFAGCGTTGQQATSSNGKTSATNPGKLTQITMSEPVRVLSFAPVYVAIEKGFFKEEGLDVKIASGGGGSQVMATLISGQAQFGIAAPNAALKTISAGKEVQIVQSINSALTFDIVLSDAYLKKKGIDPAKPMTLKEKVAALKGATLATDSVGDSGDVFLRYLMELYGQSSEDIKVVKVSGRGPKISAMKEGIVDGGINSTPFAQESAALNVGKLWISSFDVPEYSKMAWEIVFSLKDYAQKNRDTVIKTVRAVGKGIEFSREKPQEAAAAISSYFEGTDIKIIEGGLVSLKKAFNGHGEMNQEAWDNAQKPLVKFSKLTGIEQAINTSPDTFWTNKYIEEAFKK